MFWEYKIETFDEWNENSVFEMLKELGKMKWELIHVSQSLRTYFFKRQL